MTDHNRTREALERANSLRDAGAPAWEVIDAMLLCLGEMRPTPAPEAQGERCMVEGCEGDSCWRDAERERSDEPRREVPVDEPEVRLWGEAVDGTPLRANHGLLVQRGDELAEALTGARQRIRELVGELQAAVKREREKFARQLTIQRDNNHERNIELDALHYVWCDGGCEGGVHRFAHRTPLTEEIVRAAERNTKRMRSWLDNHQARRIRDESEPEHD